MRLKNFSWACLVLLLCFSGCKNPQKKEATQHKEKQKSGVATSVQNDSVMVTPVRHASFVMQLNGQVIYVDPVGGAELYKDLPAPDLVLVTHQHPDHFSPKTLAALVAKTTPLIVTKTVKEMLPDTLKKQAQVMKNGALKTLKGITVKAVPAYNLRLEAQKFHPKGKGNGYVLTFRDTRVYISGDTGPVPEIRALDSIDVAFVCMNLPYTMAVDQAIDLVLAFNPKKVYPYHYKGKTGFSDVAKFKTKVEAENPDITVQLLNWYPQ